MRPPRPPHRGRTHPPRLPLSNSSSAPLPQVLPATPAVLAGPHVPQPPLKNQPTSHPVFWVPSSPPHAWSGSHCPLDPFSGPVGLSLSPRPLLRPIRPSLPLGPHLRCCLSLSIPTGSTSGPVRPSRPPQPPMGRLTAHPALSIPWGPGRPLHPLHQAISLPGRHPRPCLPPRFRTAGQTLTTP